MKTEGKVARRYAQALVELCSPVEAERVRDDLRTFTSLWNSHLELRDTLLNPAISLAERKAVLTDISDLLGGPTQRIANLLSLLLENGRISGVELITQSFSKIVDELKKLLALKIESAREVSEQDKHELIAKLQKEFGTLASVEWNLNPQIIAGVRVRSGDTLYDSSVRGALDRAQTALIKDQHS